MRIFILCMSSWFLFSCGSSSVKKDDNLVKKDDKPSLPVQQVIPQPPVKEMFTIFHATDDSESVYISGVGPTRLSGFYLLPGECIFLADYDFSTLTVHFGAGFLDSLYRGSLDASYMVCSGNLAVHEEDICKPGNYLIKNQGSWLNNYYVMEPQKSQHQDLDNCVYVEDKIDKK